MLVGRHWIWAVSRQVRSQVRDLPSCFWSLNRTFSILISLSASVLFRLKEHVVVQSLSRVRLFVTPWTAAGQASLFISNSQSLLKLMSLKLAMPSNHLLLCRPLLEAPVFNFPITRVFSNESLLHIRWPKYWSFSFSLSISNEYSGLISFRIDCFDLLAVQGTLKSFLQHHSSKASVLWHLALFVVQLSHPYMTSGKTIALLDRPLSAR